MAVIFSLLFLAAFGCLVIGMIKPSVFSAYFKNGATRGKLLLIFGGTTFLSMLFIGSSQDTSSISASNNTGITGLDNRNAVTITKAEFDQIQMGMSYEQVREIIGGDGDVMSEVEIGGMRTVVYMWKGNSLGANANFTFTSGALQARAQFGLK